MAYAPFDPFFAAGTAINGRVMIASQAKQSCQAVFFAPDRALVVKQALGRPGQDAICYLDAVGVLPGRIGNQRGGGFILHFRLNKVRSTRIAARLMWLLDQRGCSVEQRADPRIIPHHRAVIVRLPDESVTEGRVDNLSKSGALVSLAASAPLQVGAGVTLGKRYATVMRLQCDAVAEQFRLPFCDETFHPGVIL